MDNKTPKTVKGFIRCLPKSAGLDETTRVTVVADDGTEYYVLHKGIGVDLIDHISANVEVTGIVTPREDDTYTILIRNYQLDDGYEDAWYDDDVTEE